MSIAVDDIGLGPQLNSNAEEESKPDNSHISNGQNP